MNNLIQSLHAWSLQWANTRWGTWAFFICAFAYALILPLSTPMFFIASVVSRGARFFLVAFLIWKLGPRIKQFLEKYFNLLALSFTACLIVGFVAIKYLF